MEKSTSHDAYAVLRIRNFRFFILGRFFLTLAIQMQSVIVGWQVYEITHDLFSLGLIGLAEAIPFLGFALIAGHVADRVRRRRIILFMNGLYLFCALAFLFLSFSGRQAWPLYIVLGISGLARAFFYPAQAAYMAQIVPRNLYANSTTWNSTVWHIAAVGGPAAGGLIYGFAGVHAAFGSVVILAVIAMIMFLQAQSLPVPGDRKQEGLLSSLKDGIRFVLRTQELVGAMALDMFGVLFGGAVALLPAFAADILHTGPQGLGLLRAAPALGAVLMAFYLAYHPPVTKSGYKLLAGVGGFGLCIILFAISKQFWLSFLLLAFSGMFDNISVIIRGTVMQLYTPDVMRGRVASVNSIFIGSSNELGSFESGLAAKLLGLIPSVIFGGTMTVLIVAGAARFAPKLRRMEIRRSVSVD